MSKAPCLPCACARMTAQPSPNQDGFSYVPLFKSCIVPLSRRYNWNPAVKNIQEMQEEFRRVSMLPKTTNNWYLAQFTPWIITFTYIFHSYLNFQTQQWQYHLLPNMVPRRCTHYKPHTRRSNFL